MSNCAANNYNYVVAVGDICLHNVHKALEIAVGFPWWIDNFTNPWYSNSITKSQWCELILLPETGIIACYFVCTVGHVVLVQTAGAVLFVNSGLFHIHTYTYSNLSVYFKNEFSNADTDTDKLIWIGRSRFGCFLLIDINYKVIVIQFIKLFSLFNNTKQNSFLYTERFLF